MVELRRLLGDPRPRFSATMQQSTQQIRSLSVRTLFGGRRRSRAWNGIALCAPPRAERTRALIGQFDPHPRSAGAGENRAW